MTSGYRYILLILTGAFLTLLSSDGFCQIPRQISYQGLLVSPSGIPIGNGKHVLKISLYDSPNAQFDIYNESIETQTNNGLFSLIIGGITPIPGNLDFSKQYWLGVSVDGGSEMVPRTALTSVPYALHAEVADRATHISSDAKGVVTSINEVDGPIRIIGDSLTKVTQVGQVITISSLPDGILGIQNIDGTIVVQNPNGPLVTIGVADTSISEQKLARNAVSTDKIQNFAVTTDKIQNSAVTGEKINQMGALTNQVLKWDGTKWSPGKDDTTSIKAGTGVVITKNANGENVISSTLIGLPNGTTGATLRHDGNNWISNTFLYNDGGRIGIGTISPNAMLDISGNFMVSNSGNTSSEFRIQEPSMNGTRFSYTSFKSAPQARNIDYTLPAALMPNDAIMSVNSAGIMTWQTALPATVTVPFSQITSGINTGQDLRVGDSSHLHPVGTGLITANQLSGSSLGGSSYAGRIAVPIGTTSLKVNLAPSVGCKPTSSVTVSQFDSEGYNVIVATMVTEIKQDSFTVQFSASYPTDTGYVTYLVVNP